MNPEVEIVALGARTPVGLTAESSAAAVRAGISRRALYPFIDRFGEPIVVAADPRLERRLEGRDRLLPIIESVLKEILSKLCAAQTHRMVIRVLIALPEARPGFSDADATWIADTVYAGAKDSIICVEVAGRGHAGAIFAVERVIRECAGSSDELFVIIGADSYLHSGTFAWLEGDRRLAQPGIRSGFVPGEGSGGLALASVALRNRLGLPRLAGIRGVQTAQETLLRGSEIGSLGVALSTAVMGAVRRLALPHEGIDTIYTDLNGERYRSEEWGFVALRTPLVWKSLVYEAPSDCWGDLGAASATLAGVLAARSFARNYARGPRALVMAGSDNGLRGAMLLQAPHLP